MKAGWKATPEMAGRMLHRNATERDAQISKAQGLAKKRRPPCRHGGLESREETPKEGICGRSCRTATISSGASAVASVFFALWMIDSRIRTTVAFLSKRADSDEAQNNAAISMI